MSRLLINQYRKELETRKRYGGSSNEGAIRYAFATLLNGYCRPRDFILVEELSIVSRLQTKIRLDGIVKDALRLDWGYWEAKDEKDSLDAEIEAKLSKGYPIDNILFEDTKTAVLIQNGSESLRIAMEDDEALDALLNQFLDYERAEVKNFRQAISNFSQDLPIIIDTLRKLIDRQDPPASNSGNRPPTPNSGGVIQDSEVPNVGDLGANQNFIKVRDKFLKICQESINPDINIDDIREMIIQHILTEDIFNNIFSEGQFHQENNIARQLNEVIKTFFTGNVKRNTFKTIQSYYNAIIRTASSIVNHQEKQKFLKVVYENFYKAYNPKEADRLGIVYTPNEIVKFMVQSTDYLLEKHFNKTLGDKGVEILDPCTGTGTFITEILDSLLTRDIEYKYQNEIHCNEMSILPYYIANLNIEYTYQQITKQYLEFENICLVDTLNPTDKGEKQLNMFAMNEENTERIKRQNEKKISVIIGNPPYNAKQENFNDNNANRKYESIDRRIKNSYIKEGTAQNQIVVYDMYTRFIRWATDRLHDEGIIAFISNSSFIDALAFDGFRKIIAQEFNEIWVINTKGNARNSGERRRQEGGNVFSDLIKVGIAVYFLIKNPKKEGFKIYYHELDDYLKADDKKAFFVQNRIENIEFETIKPDSNNNWINQTDNDFDDLIPLIDKDVKAGKTKAVKNEETGELENKICDEAIFQLFFRGMETGRDEWVYDINKENLEIKVKFLINTYQATLQDNKYQDKDKIKWDRELTKYLDKKINKNFDIQQITDSLYRPFSSNYFYFDRHFNRMPSYWFSLKTEDNVDNKIIILPGISSPKDFHCLISRKIVDMNCLPAGCQCLPLYRYENGERKENITDWALNKFKKYYNVEQPSRLSLSDRQDACFTGEDNKINNIEKIDIFHYVYGVLYNPEYRSKYELNLKREFPRIPFYNDFWQWSKWGKQLIELHLNYETIKPYKLTRIDIPLNNPEATPKPKLKADKVNHKIIIDEVTTLTEIPPLAWEYKLGNRSALEWILDQYKEKKSKDKTIAEKFNNYRFADYKEAVIELLKKVTTVSVETMKIIEAMKL
ncbi:type ISP restriction/modification enzyme [Geminocystis herdmanii]|uniref:type ISP restriction/modification enzyme n=1 Tax=Geminocystis herdmanii TaxID=669359 RepID=UPI0003458E38|nr:type ISP restriction/modification enzyme [Geminocystis herdmanii]